MKVMPVKWDSRRDALACVSCGEPFRKNDLVYPKGLTGGVTVHYRRGCAEMYNRDDEEIREKAVRGYTV